MPKLKHAKHEELCQEFLKDLNQTAAYRRVYGNLKSPTVTESAASRAFRSVKVKARIAELMEKRTKRVERSQDAILKDIQEIKDRCMQAQPVIDKDGNVVGEWKFDPSPALKALELEGKHKAMWIEKLKAEHTVGHKTIIEQLEGDGEEDG